jgi:ABC-2 type transport system permease protein
MDLAARLAPPGRAFAASVRLGWEVSSNWTQPLVFVIYSILRPLSSALILVVIYTFVTGRRGSTGTYLAFLVTGTAFWGFVNSGLAGFAIGIAEDRGRFRMLKYVYIAPQRFFLFLLGRGAVQLANAAAATAIVLTVGTLALHLPIDPLRVNYALLAAACLLAFAAVMATATAYTVTLLAARDSYSYADLGAQMLFVLSGAIFPISVLPGPVAAVAAWSPLAYWMESVRRALLRDQALRMFPHLSDAAVLGRLGVTAALTIALAWLLYRWADRRARQSGLIDMESNW